MRLFVPVDQPTVAEAVLLGRAVTRHDVGLAIGARLLVRTGGPTVTALAGFGPVLADARLSGSRSDVVTAARYLAADGASAVTVAATTGVGTISDAVEALRPHGCRVVVVTVPPDADAAAVDAATGRSGRGRAVSLLVAMLAGLDVDVLGEPLDTGVVAQVAEGIGVIVGGVRTAEEVSDARVRGAVAAVVDPAVIDVRDPAASIADLARAAAAG